MKRGKFFFLFSLIFSAMLFGVYRTPFNLYWGFFYSMVFMLVIRDIKEKTVIDIWSWIGLGLILVSPLFLIVGIGKGISPSSFQAFVMLGLFLILFEQETGRILVMLSLGELFIALGVRNCIVKEAIRKSSYLFVKVTSYLVRIGIHLLGIPITMEGNIANVKNSIVIIGSGCSGLDAFVIYILAAFLLIYLRKSSRKEALLLLFGAVGIVPLNALRIFLLLVIGYYSGISFLELFHSHLGDLMFLVYVFFYWWLITGRKKKSLSGF